MPYIAFLLEDGKATGIASIMAEKSKWVRWLKPPFFSKHEKGFPVPVTFPTRRAASNHMRSVILHAKKAGVLQANDVEYGYAIYRIRNLRGQRHAAQKTGA